MPHSEFTHVDGRPVPKEWNGPDEFAEVAGGPEFPDWAAWAVVWTDDTGETCRAYRDDQRAEADRCFAIRRLNRDPVSLYAVTDGRRGARVAWFKPACR